MSANEARAYWEQRLREHPNERGVGCGAAGLAYNRWLYRLRRFRFRRVLRRIPWPVGQARVLDVGCGTGFYIEQWKRAGAKSVEGLDLTEASVERLADLHPDCRFHRADIADEADSLSSGPFDVVSAYDVLFHIVDDQRYLTALRRIAGLMPSGGYFLYSDNFVHHEHARSGTYHYSRTIQAIAAALDEAGFEVIERVPMFVLMNAPDDSKSPALRFWWRLVSAVLRRGERLSGLLGALLFPVDLLLTNVVKESPTTEIAICRRR